MVGSSAISMELLQEFQLNSCHVSLFTSICQIPDFCLTPTNPMQLPFFRWYNPNKRCDVRVGSSAISIEQLREFQESSPEAGEQKRVVSVKEGVIGYIDPRASSEWHVIENAWQNTDIARKADSRMAMNCQSYCYGILHFVSGSHLILQRNMSFFVSLLLWNHEMFLSNGILTKYFDWTPTRKIKSVLIPEKTWCSLKWQEMTELILSSCTTKLNHTLYS